jgi:hypothetical protein
MESKKGCFLISSASVGPAPSLLFGLRFRRDIRRDLASFEMLAGSLRTPF